MGQGDNKDFFNPDFQQSALIETLSKGKFMFKVSQVGKDRLDITMSGKLNSEEMKEALDELVNKAKDIHDGKLLYDVVDFHLPSLNAIAIEFSRFPAMFAWIRKFKRAAVLTDKTWVRKISELEGALIPGLDIKGFERDQKDEAVAWLEN